MLHTILSVRIDEANSLSLMNLSDEVNYVTTTESSRGRETALTGVIAANANTVATIGSVSTLFFSRKCSFFPWKMIEPKNIFLFYKGIAYAAKVASIRSPLDSDRSISKV
jgi:hypothetical protein